MGLYEFAIQIASLHPTGIEGNIVGKAAKLRRWLRIKPGGIFGLLITDANAVIGRLAFPFAKATAQATTEIL